LFDEKNESNNNTNIGTDLGFASSLLNASGTTSFSAQRTNLELVTSELFMWIEQIQNELNKVINANIIKDSKNRMEAYYLPITHINKKDMVAYAKELYMQGKGSLSLWSSCCGIPSNVFFALLDEELEADIENKYPVHKTSSTLSKEDQKSAGRDQIDDPTNENTVISKTNNSNQTAKPSTS